MFPSSRMDSSLFLPSCQRVLVCNMPRFQAHQPTPPSSSPPASESPFCNVPCFRAHQPVPPSSSPPGSESSFAMCHVSELTNPLSPAFSPPASGLAHLLSTWATTTCPMRSCSSVCGSIHPPIHPPSQKSFVSWPTGIHRITRMPHDANRQVLADLPHPPSHLQYTLPTTSAVQVAYTACIHRCRMWFSRRALPRNPW